MKELQNVWDTAKKYSHSKEDKKIAELQKRNFDKYETLKSILGTEIEKTKRLSEKWENNLKNPYIIQVANNDESSDVVAYNKELQPYHDAFVAAAKNLVTPNKTVHDDIKTEANNLLARIADTKNNLLAANTVTHSSVSSGPSCQNKTNASRYNYKGLYVIEAGQSYRLFDYMDELDGQEETKIIDIDNDGDDDLLYFMNKQLFIKENMNNTSDIRTDNNPFFLSWNNNKFLNGDRFIEAVNGVEALGIHSQGVNISFLSHNDSSVSQYRLIFFPIIDAFLNKDNNNYYPANIKKYIYDFFSDIDKNLLLESDEIYTLSKNLGFIKRI
jgi:hypothetical protein